MTSRLTPRDYFNIFLEDLPALALMIAALLTVVWSVASRPWIGGLGALFIILTVSLIICYTLTLSEMSDLFALAYASFFAVVTVWWSAARQLEIPLEMGPVTFRDKLFMVADRVGIWVNQAFTGEYSQDPLVFFIVLALIVWYLGFSAMWNLFRTHRLWQATVPPGLALLIVVYYEPTNRSLEYLVLFYLFLVLLLAVYTNILNREALWAREGLPISPNTRKVVMRAGLVIVSVLMLSAWLAPTVEANERLQDWWDSNRNPWSNVQQEAERLFGGVDNTPATVPDYYGGSTLSMGGPVDLSNDPVMNVYAPFGYRYYWQSKVFDTYSSGQWTTNADLRIRSPFGNIRDEQQTPYFARIPLQQRVEVLVNPGTELLYAAPMPAGFGAMGVASEVILTSDNEEYGSLTLVRAQNIVEAGEIYETTSMFSVADAQALRNAGTNYPQWVTNNFLDLPENVTPRTRDLAEFLASGNSNPYDTAKAVENFVRTTITYNESVPAPPVGVEPVDYTLFERPEGYCNYYASSMAVLLRSVGIPARVVAGFSQGEYDVELGAYTVLESNAHTWVEVYFPNYGWVQFEPTAAEDPIFRPEGDAEQQPTPTPNLQEPNVPQSEGTPTPTPEGDDPLAPLPEANPGSDAPFISRALLGVLRLIWWGTLAFVLGGGGLLGLWFWFEQRGMRDLSDVSRSYARMNAYAGLTGINPQPTHTPYERARQIVDSVPEAEKPVYSIVRMYVEEQYNPNAHMTRDRLRLRQKAQNAWREARLTFIKQAIQRRINKLLRRSET